MDGNGPRESAVAEIEDDLAPGDYYLTGVVDGPDGPRPYKVLVHGLTEEEKRLTLGPPATKEALAGQSLGTPSGSVRRLGVGKLFL